MLNYRKKNAINYFTHLLCLVLCYIAVLGAVLHTGASPLFVLQLTLQLLDILLQFAVFH